VDEHAADQRYQPKAPAVAARLIEDSAGPAVERLPRAFFYRKSLSFSCANSRSNFWAIEMAGEPPICVDLLPPRYVTVTISLSVAYDPVIRHPINSVVTSLQATATQNPSRR
jgi:hypothetical protein